MDTRLILQLDQLEYSGLIRIAQLEPEMEYLFRHTLVQEAAYESLLRQDRRRLHRAVGEALERLYPERAEELAAVLAYHFAQAEEHERALHYSTVAADHAFRQYANAEAVMHYARALEIAARDDGCPSEMLAHLYLSRGRALELTARYPEALQGYQEMEAIGQERGDQALVLAALMAQATIHATPSGVHDADKAIALGERALELAHALGDRAAVSKTLWILALAHGYGRGDALQAIALGEQSLVIARQLGLREQIAYTLTDLGNMYTAGGRIGQGLAALEEAEHIWRELHNLPMLAFDLNLAAQVALTVGDFPRGLTLAEEGLAISRSIDNAEGAAYSLSTIGVAHLETGHLGTGLRHLQESVQTAEASGLLLFASWGMGRLALAYQTVGAHALARQMADRASAAGVLERLPAAVQAEALLSLVRFEAAAGHHERGLALAEQIAASIDLSNLVLDVRFWTGLAQGEVYLAQGHPNQALAAVDGFLESVLHSRAMGMMPDGLHSRGRMLAALGRLDEASSTLREARAHAEEMGAALIRWRILTLLADVEGRRGHTEEAAALRQEARTASEALAESLADFPDVRASFLALPEVRELVGE